jgi:hypothetical protein
VTGKFLTSLDDVSTLTGGLPVLRDLDFDGITKHHSEDLLSPHTDPDMSGEKN